MLMALNQAINDRGGFLRKSSTTIYHLRRHRQRRLRQVSAHIGLEYPAGTTIYRRVRAWGVAQASLEGNDSTPAVTEVTT
jgi:hypothetical protein